MKNLCHLTVSILAMLLLVGCSGSKKVQPIIQFTNLLSPDVSQPVKIKPPTTELSLNEVEQYNVASAELIAEPVLVGNVVYALDKYGAVRATNLVTSKTLWNTELTTARFSKEYIGGGITYAGGKLYVTYGDVYLVQLDAETGLEIMRARLNDVVSSKPLVHKDIIVVQTDNNQLYGFSSSLTEPLWRHGVYPEVITVAASVYPALYEGNVFVTYSSGHLFHINIENGEQIWASIIDAPKEVLPNYMPSGIHIQPLIKGKTAYMATAGGELVKSSLENGKVIWRKAVSDIQSMSYDQGTLYVTTNARQVAALNSENGDIIWVTDLIDRASLKKLPDPTIHFAPVATNNILLVYTADAKSYQLDIQTGHVLSEDKAPNKMTFSYLSAKKQLISVFGNKMRVTK